MGGGGVWDGVANVGGIGGREQVGAQVGAGPHWGSSLGQGPGLGVGLEVGLEACSSE